MAAVRSLIRDIEHRRAVDGDPDFVEIVSDEAGDQTRGPFGSGRLKPRLDRCGGRVCAPVRRPHSLHPAALLIDQHRRVSAADAFPERPRQLTHLVAVSDVALEEDEAPRVFPPKEGAFLSIEREAGAAADEGLRHLRLPAGAQGRRGASLTWR